MTGAALAELDRLLAGLTAGRSDAPTPGRLRARMVRGLWWRVCAEAATADPARLRAWYADDDPITGLFGEHPTDPTRSAARAVAAVALAAAGEHAARMSAAEHWAGTGVLTGTEAIPPTDLFPRTDLPAPVRAVLGPLTRRAASPAEAYAVIAAVLMATDPPRSAPRPVALLFDAVGTDPGATGTLELTVLPGGPPGLYPDPRTMAFLRVDADFAPSAAAAWRRYGRPGDCVLWSVAVHDTEDLPRIHGGSLGLAFAVALADLRRSRAARFVLAHDSSCALTGTVTADGAVGPVGGLDGKFAAAKRRGWRVVAPSDDRAGAECKAAGTRVRWVDTVDQACRASRRAVRGVLVSCLAFLLVATGAVVAVSRISAERAAASEHLRDRVVRNLLADADRQRPLDREGALRAGLAAVALRDDSSTRADLTASLVTDRPVTRFIEGREAVSAAAFGPQGTMVTGDDLGVRLWDASRVTAPALRRVLSTGTRSTAVAISSDGLLAAALLEDQPGRRYARLWDTNGVDDNGREVEVPPGCAPVSLAVAPRERVLVGCENGTVALSDGAGARPLPKGHKGLRSVAFGADGAVAVVGADDGLAVSDLADPRAPRDITGTYTFGNDPRAEPWGVRAAAVSADGQTLLLGGQAGEAQVLRSRGTRREKEPSRLTVVDVPEVVSAVALSADGTIAITIGMRTGKRKGVARVWRRSDDPTRGYVPVLALDRHDDAVLSVAVSPDGRMAVTGGADGAAVLWDLSLDGIVESSQTTPRTSGEGGRRERETCHAAQPLCVLVGADGQAVLWDVTSPGSPRRAAGLARGGAIACCVAFAPVEPVVAVAMADGRAVRWDVRDPDEPVQLPDIPTAAAESTAVAFLGPTVLAIGSNDGAVALWDLTNPDHPTRRTVIHSAAHAVSALAYHPRSAVLAVGHADGAITLYDARDVAAPARLGVLPQRAGAVLDLAFHPWEPTLAAADASGNGPTLWDVTDPASPVESGRLDGHTDIVESLALHAGTELAATTSQDGTVIIWSLRDPRRPVRLTRLAGHTGTVHTAAFVTDGTTLLTTGGPTTLAWDTGEIAGMATDPVSAACAKVTRPLNRQEWEYRVAAEFPYRQSC
ncbi:hypothetical protein V5P93_002963 [Actinokineospora auranticolor]|uniref:WD40 repeat protein n=1 Tax=Actinokineospora auranticolor TaxID=155976 RepID=A0A2S6H0U9_9PSEU|nr:hypothetical protein [Actinokineospora auranticolor]PPK71102.1 WD40 repeat protein [Actinokineospora auranticolor]